MSDPDESELNTIAINVQATVVNNPPVFQQASYTFEISENSNDTQEISSLSVSDDSGESAVGLILPCIYTIYIVRGIGYCICMGIQWNLRIKDTLETT